MEQKFIFIEGISIACFEKNDDKKNTIFFIHGNSVSSRTWRKQLDDALFDNYRLIALDLPAHGHSGSANGHHSLYNLPGLAAIMAKAVEQLANDRPYIVAGVSLGTNIVVEMLAFDINPKGLVLAGPSVVGQSCPVGKIIKPGTQVNVVFTDDPDMEDVKTYSGETSLSTDEKDHHFFLEDFQLVKKPFRSALAQSIAAEKYSDEISLLQEKNISLLVVFGKDEKVIDADYLDEVPLPLWRDTIFKLPGASHLVHIDQPAAFNELMADFATDIFK